MSANKHVHGGVEFGVYICDTANNKATRTPEAAANARLIAAAPDLLAALEAAKEEIRLIRMKDANVVYNPALQSMMSAAIAKARG
jgi:hypothetical protein